MILEDVLVDESTEEVDETVEEVEESVETLEDVEDWLELEAEVELGATFAAEIAFKTPESTQEVDGVVYPVNEFANT